MMLAVALLAGAMMVLWLAPGVLVLAVRRRLEPRAALTAWVLLVTSTFLTLVAAAAVSLWPGHGPARQIAQFLQHCWAALSHGEMPGLDAVVGLAGITLLVITTSRVLLAGSRRIRVQRGLYRRHVDLLRGIARVEPGRYPLLWLEHPEPVAYSVVASSTDRSVIVASRGLTDRLPVQDVAAVIDHERAHLRGRHHFLVALAEALAAAMPRFPLMRTSPALIRTLVELAADRSAARAHGTATVRAALVAMSGQGVPPRSLAMGGDSVSVRLRWLEPAGLPGRLRSTAVAVLAGVSAALAPAVLGSGLIAVMGLMTCASLALS